MTEGIKISNETQMNKLNCLYLNTKRTMMGSKKSLILHNEKQWQIKNGNDDDGT